ncbi:peptidoglycan-binding protein LysM [Cognatazoarcus halotolerans]|uniref:peptidoglycan-binding protein LysM n=1 Tax=Cognatazoarcus halotolerans TaxID=2686016 RepID=UPI001356DA6D|nr:peptidoglycan-binding protein LysM [Cognatazoarcus halotolerans]MBX3679873.1 peptidoglycan-binding protein LysM [Rhodocyclaceae bacterium]MCB1899059.1 peptidoglycan-binding protein LysM [Rhodocyclaceae bacterium]MCP5308077.1 peptidoglycan-binding protein LysM [Zoogloeaceae bacterium]
MGLFSFIKDAGEKLFGSGEAKAAQEAAATNPTADNVAAANDKAAAAIKHYIATLNLAPADLVVSFDGSTGVVTVSGTAPDQAAKERILLAAGNVQGVGEVQDNMSVSSPEAEAVFYTVKRGDTLSAIAKAQYGNANKYMAIFEANKPMLSHPDKIYPGQVLRIPPQA